MPIKLLPLTAFLRDYESALEWLQALGVRVQNTRLSRYRDTIEEAIRLEARSSYGHQRTSRFSNAIIEASDIIDIAKLDPRSFLANPHALAKLKDLPRGVDEVPDEAHDPARDYGFEFATAAMLHGEGAFGGFGGSGDALQVPGWHPWECKRVTSVEAAYDQLRAARNQLRRAYNAGVSGGIIALDLTRPLRRRFGNLTAESDDGLREATQRSIQALLPKIILDGNTISRIAHPSVLGVWIRFTAIGMRGTRDHIRRMTSWQLIEAHAPLSVENELFLTASGSLKRLSEGTIEELLLAERQVLNIDRHWGPSKTSLSYEVERILNRSY